MGLIGLGVLGAMRYNSLNDTHKRNYLLKYRFPLSQYALAQDFHKHHEPSDKLRHLGESRGDGDLGSWWMRFIHGRTSRA